MDREVNWPQELDGQWAIDDQQGRRTSQPVRVSRADWQGKRTSKSIKADWYPVKQTGRPMVARAVGKAHRGVGL